MLFMSCVCHAFASVLCCLVVTCWETADLLALICGVKLCSCYFPMWYPGSVGYLIVSIPDHCCLSYFKNLYQKWLMFILNFLSFDIIISFSGEHKSRFMTICYKVLPELIFFNTLHTDCFMH